MASKEHRFINACAPEMAQDISAELAREIQEGRPLEISRGRSLDAHSIRRERSLEASGSPRRPAYVRDIEKILYTPAYNRLAGKTQVFSFRDNDDLTRRGLHVQLVGRVAKDIGQALGLNLDLIEAIALGHDIGHTPFGHAGERFLNDIFHERTGRFFQHNVQSVRVLDRLYGRNLTLATLDGILVHNGEFVQSHFPLSGLESFDQFDDNIDRAWRQGRDATKHLRPMALEAAVVRISDIIAYVGKDRQDAIEAGLVTPDAFEDGLGGAYNAWALSAFTADIIEHSAHSSMIQMSDTAFQELRRAKRENSEKIYMAQEVNDQCSRSIRQEFYDLYEHELAQLKRNRKDTAIYKHHIQPISRQLSYYGKTYDWQEDPDLCVVDYISSMTDDYFLAMIQKALGVSPERIPKRNYFDHVEPGLI